ncbi:CoA pyrophosphatase [Albimonas sp. CAU 1670]|uniref:CoA pyrophosphatase n=1 Tax=Albimonas sp. CAU 1670 TaxID=3032599 RepID=UPI0023D99B7E|nr:CoA pyrophosphatase [Albimonas sp. CAU 1670]MDF2231357.1 CoA pyrophosphatase [Albimonas sp. CAU 1670]
MPSDASPVSGSRPAAPISPDLVREAVLRGRRGASSDFDLNPHVLRPDAPAAPLRQAGVLCALVDRGDGAGLRVILTRRADHLRKHAGQVAFPGGGLEAGDDSLLHAALREADEEIGLNPDHVDVVGEIDGHETVTGFAVTPFVGFVPASFVARPDPGEVAEVFEPPLDFLMNPANQLRESRLHQGERRFFYAMPWQGRYIWGATARMLVGLSERIASLSIGDETRR